MFVDCVIRLCFSGTALQLSQSVPEGMLHGWSAADYELYPGQRNGIGLARRQKVIYRRWEFYAHQKSYLRKHFVFPEELPTVSH